MVRHDFECQKCCHIFETCHSINEIPKTVCPKCGGNNNKQMIATTISITGSRDNFGIGKEFVDERTGKVIDNFKSWEKAGYGDIGSIKNPELKERVKEQIVNKKQKRAKPLDNSSLLL